MAQERNEMQLAEILSDLVSLRPGVCDPAAALALVSTRPSTSTSPPIPSATTPAADAQTKAQPDEEGRQDADLNRAKELVRLHYEVRERYKRGDLTRGLAEARAAVQRALG